MQYKALSRIKLGGWNIEPGEVVDLTEHDASRLLEQGALELVHQPFASGELTLKINREA